MKKLILPVAAALVMLASCQKEAIKEATSTSGIELTASLEQQVDPLTTKTTLDGTTVKWEEGDCIKVFDSAGKSVKLIALSNGTESSFVESVPTVRDDDFDEENLAYAIYPYSTAATCAGSTITFTLPASQTYSENSFGQNSNVAVGAISDKSISFSNACGVLKISLTGTMKVGKIILNDNAGKKLCGTFSVDASSLGDGASYKTSAADGQSFITLDCGDGVQLSDSPTAFYFVVPAGSFIEGSGFTARIYEQGTNNFIPLHTNSANIIVRSKVKRMPEGALTVITAPEYTGVQYLKTSMSTSTGAYMEVGTLAPGDSVSIDCAIFDSPLYSSSKDVCFYGYYTSVPSPSYCSLGMLMNDTKGGIYYRCNIGGNYVTEVNFGTRINAALTTDGYWKIDGEKQPQPAVNLEGGTSSYLFARHYKSSSIDYAIYSSMSCYGFIHHRGGTDMMNLLPVQRIDDGKPGMYDLVSGTLLVAIGGGEFTTDLDD